MIPIIPIKAAMQEMKTAIENPHIITELHGHGYFPVFAKHGQKYMETMESPHRDPYLQAALALFNTAA